MTSARRWEWIVLGTEPLAVHLRPTAIHAIFAAYTHLIEALSLDEAYLDVTQDCVVWGRRRPRHKISARAFSMRPGSRRQREFPTTSSLPSWRQASASRKGSS
jgi:nucleotidyltransferase/DNA polymerase involved in DNA repair